MSRNLGITAACLPGISELDALPLIKDAGFDMVFAETSDPDMICRMKEKCDQLGLSLDFVHAPYRGVNDFWVEGDAYLPLWQGIKNSIIGCERAQVPVAVCHVSSGWFPPQICDVGLARFDELVNFASERGVTIAFENLRKFGVLAAIMERYEQNPKVGFCYDCGHEHCYTGSVHYTDLYGDRLLCTHLHDNHGRDPKDIWADGDEHLMPFDGNIDYADMMARLHKTSYKGALTLELVNEYQYRTLSAPEFLKIAYERVCRIAALEPKTS